MVDFSGENFTALLSRVTMARANSWRSPCAVTDSSGTVAAIDILRARAVAHTSS